MNHSRRLHGLMEAIERPLLVTSLVNIRYLTGFTGSNAQLVVAPDGSTMLTDGRYGEVAGLLVDDLGATDLVVYTGGMVDEVASALGPAEAVDVEAAHVTWDFVRQLGEASSAELVPTVGVVEARRSVKDDDEVAALRRAAAAGDVALSIVSQIRAAAESEGDLGEGLVAEMARAGGERAGWPPIVAVGANAARPHHRSGTGAIEDGLLLLDFGCVVDGYHSDMSRTLWYGGAIPGDVADVYDAVLESNLAGVAAVRPGVTAGSIDEASRGVLRARGYEEHFLHSTGHGVGLDIHEAPSVRRGSEEVLAPGNVITVEPGVYLPGRFGVRIEDMVLVTEDGGEVLTSSGKELLAT